MARLRARDHCEILGCEQEVVQSARVPGLALLASLALLQAKLGLHFSRIDQLDVAEAGALDQKAQRQRMHRLAMRRVDRPGPGPGDEALDVDRLEDEPAAGSKLGARQMNESDRARE